jgi:site-specific DNA recombinase
MVYTAFDFFFYYTINLSFCLVVFCLQVFYSLKCRDGKRNNHKYKSTDSAIRIEGGCPQIISKELFDRVQQRRENNKQRCGKYHSTEFYLLTGKVFCGICGKRMIGNVRYSGRSKLRLATYRCNTHRTECKNKELNKDYLDVYVQKLLQEKLFNQGALKKTVTHINQYIRKYNQQYESHYSSIAVDYQEVLQNLNNITKDIERGILTDSIIARAEELESQKTTLETKLQEMHQLEDITYSDVAELLTTWKSLKPDTEEFRTFVQQYVKQITVYPYHFEVILDKGLGITEELAETISMRRGELYAMFDSRVRE